MKEHWSALENNELAFVASHRSAMWALDFGKMFVSSDPGVATWNFIGALSGQNVDPESIIERSEAIYADWNRTPTLKVTPMSSPAGIEDVLIGRGWKLAASLTHMEHTDAVRSRPDIKVRRCRSEEEIRLFSEVQSQGFESPEWFAWVHKVNMVNRTRRNQLFYLAELGSRPVGVLLLLRTQGIGGLYAVATLPDARGRGVAQALVGRAIEDSRRLGDRSVCLNTATGGPAAKAFARLGFRPVFDSRFYTRS